MEDQTLILIRSRQFILAFIGSAYFDAYYEVAIIMKYVNLNSYCAHMVQNTVSAHALARIILVGKVQAFAIRKVNYLHKTLHSMHMN